MASAGDGSAPYGTAGAGGKLRKRHSRRSIPATPYDRPPTVLKNNNPSMLKKLMDPASRLVYAGAHRLFNVFRKSLPPLSLQRPPGSNEGPQNVSQEERRSDGSSKTVAATGISELEQILQEKTFTRTEIQRLTSLLHSRSTKSPSDDSLETHGDVRDNFHAAISTPIVTSKVLEEFASPAELAKSYMGSRPTTKPLRQDSKLIQRTPITTAAQKAANSLRDLENGFVTPRSRGRSAMYTMARTPYTRSPIFSQKGIRSDYGHGAASTSSQSISGHEGKMALKHSSVLDDAIGSGGPLRRIRRKTNVSSERDKELGYAVFQQDGSSQNLLLPNETEPKVSGYASVPAKSTHTANKILQHLEKPSLKEKNDKNSISSHIGTIEKSPNKLTLDMLHGRALRSLEKVDAPKFLPSRPREAHHHARLHEPTSERKDKTEENGSRKFLVPNNMLTSVNDDSTNSLKDKAPIVGLTKLPSKFQEEPPQKKRAFQTNALEDSVERDGGIHDNGHASLQLLKNNKPETSVADIIKIPALPEVSKTHALVQNNNTVLPEVAKVPEPAKVKEAANATSFLKTDGGFLSGFVREQGSGFKIPISSPSTTTTHSSALPQSTTQMEKVTSKKDSSFSSFVKPSENALPAPFSPNQSSELKPNSSSDPKTNYSISVNGNGNGNGDGNDQKSANIIGKSVSSFPAVPASGSSLFGTSTKNLSAPNMTPASNPTTFSSLAPFPAPGSTSAAISTASTAIFTTTTTAAAIFSTSVPPPVFSFGSASSTAPTTSMAESGNTSNRSPFATTTTTADSGLFGLSSPAATLTTTSQSQGSFFNITNGSQINTQASSSSTLFVSSAPAFGSSPSISSPSSSVLAFGAPSTPTPTPTPSFVTGGTNSSFAAATLPNNNNHDHQVSMEDSMAEDAMQTQSPVSPFGQATVGAPGFTFGSATSTPSPAVPFQFGGQSNQALPAQNPFQSPSLEFNGGGGGSFSLGSGGEKSNRRIVRITKSKNRKK